MLRIPRIALFASGSLLVICFATCKEYEIYKHMAPNALPPVHAQVSSGVEPKLPG